MFKRFTGSLLAAVLIVSMFFTMGASAATNYTPGPQTQEIELANPSELDGASVSKKDTLTINGGGYAKYEFIQDFDAHSVTVEYQAYDDVNVTIKTDLATESFKLSKDETSYEHVLSQQTRAGGYSSMVISADSEVTINKITLNKVNYYSMQSELAEILVLSDYDEALMSAVVVAENSAIVKVNGAKRYIDYDAQNVAPFEHNGRLYLPLETAARAFSLYYEDYADLNYAYLSGDDFEFYYRDGECYTVKNAVKSEAENPIIYRNGKAWIHLRFIAEILGENVGYRDGIAIFDDALCVDRIIDNDDIFNALKEEMNQYNVANVGTGNVYHVSQAAYASDSNNGSENFPFATIQKAADVAEAGDTVIIHEGTYRETVIPKNSGEAMKPITYRAADGENVTISAMDKISGFQLYNADKNIWCATLPKNIGSGRNFIVYNGTHLGEGRHPNSNTTTHAVSLDMYDENCKVDRTLFPTMGDIMIRDERDSTPSADLNENARVWGDSDIDLNQDEDDYWKGATVNGMHSAGWTMSTGIVTSSTKGHIEIDDIRKYYPNSVTYGFLYYTDGSYPSERTTKDYAYLTNHINTVDMPGEWFVDEDAVLYMIPPEGASGETLEVEAKQRQICWDMSDKEYINLVGVNTIGGSIVMRDSKMCVVNGGEHKYVAHWNYNVDEHACYNDTDGRKKEGVPPRGEAGEYISGENNAWINTVVNGSANAGIYVCGVHQYVVNNEVYNTSYMGTYMSGISIENERWYDFMTKRGGHTIMNNTVKYAGRACMYNSYNFSSYGGSSRVAYPGLANDIAFNEYGYGMVCARDGGLTYMHGVAAGTDRVKSMQHHCIAYGAVSQDDWSDDGGGDVCIFYHDANSAFETLHSTIAFGTTMEAPVKSYKKLAYYKFTAPYSYTEFVNNNWIEYLPEGISGLKDEDYPLGKPFKAGRQTLGERMMSNYNKFSLENVVFLADQTLNGEAYVDGDSFISFKNPDTDSITTGTVKLGEGIKKLDLHLTGDKYTQRVNKVYITVKQNGEEVYKVGKLIGSTVTDTLDVPTVYSFYIPSTVTGDAVLEITATDTINRFSKLKIGTADAIEKDLFPASSSVIMAGSYDEWIKNSKFDISARYNATSGDFGESYVLETRDNTLIYKDRMITDDSDGIRLYAAGSAKYTGGYKAVVYVDGYKDENKVAEIDIDKYAKLSSTASKSWSKFSSEADKVLKTVPKGKHDIYVKFEDATGGECSVDFYNILFYDTSEVPKLSDPIVLSKYTNDGQKDVYPLGSTIYLAGAYDDSVLNGNYDELRLTLSSENDMYNYYSVSDTWEHTVIYNDREISQDMNAMRLYLGTSINYCKNGKVHIYMDGNDEAHKIGVADVEAAVKLDEEKAKTWSKHAIDVDMSTTVPKGKHSFYFRFEGNNYSTDFYNFMFYNK